MKNGTHNEYPFTKCLLGQISDGIPIFPSCIQIDFMLRYKHKHRAYDTVQ